MSSSLCRRLHGIFTQSSTLTPLPRTQKTATAIATTLNSLESSLPESSVSSTDNRLRAFVKKFKQASNTARFRNRNYFYETAVRRLANAKQFSLIEDILEHQKQYESITVERFTVRLMTLYGKSGMFDHAHKLFDEMPQLNCERTVMSFNALLAACVNSKKFDKISEFFRELPEKLSIEPDMVSYNIVIKALCEMGSLDAALEVLDEMEKNRFEPDLITFNTLLDAFYRNKNFSGAEKVWALLESKNVLPNARSYNPKLRALVSDNRISEAIELIEEMGRKGVKPDVYSFNALIKGFRDDGNLEEAKRWFGEMERNNCCPDRSTLKMLVPFVCQKGDFDFGLQLCKEVISRRYIIDTAAMQLVVDGLVKESKIEEAENLVESGKSNNYYHYKLKLPGDE